MVWIFALFLIAVPLTFNLSIRLALRCGTLPPKRFESASVVKFSDLFFQCTLSIRCAIREPLDRSPTPLHLVRYQGQGVCHIFAAKRDKLNHGEGSLDPAKAGYSQARTCSYRPADCSRTLA